MSTNNTMPFSTAEQIQRSQDFLNNMKKPACPGCARGVRMCYNTPCLGTPDDIERLIDAGFAKSLMLDWWVGDSTKDKMVNKVLGKENNTPSLGRKRENPFTEDIDYLVPAIEGKGGLRAPFGKHGKCGLLVDNKCSLHDIGLKPVQGTYACCKIDNVYIDANGQEKDIDERIPILHLWNTQKGKDVISRWKKEISFTKEDDEKTGLPETMPEMINSLFQLLSSHMTMYSDKGIDGRPSIDKNEKVEVVKTVYEKPY